MLLSSGLHVEAQTGTANEFLKGVMPVSPETAALMRYGECPVGPATGVPEISIPLYTVEYDGVSVPIGISYHASGIRVNDVASPVGLGWTLSGTGVICRQVCGGVDGPDGPAGWIRTRAEYLQRSAAHTLPVYDLETSCSDATTVLDTQSDRYVYTFGGHYGVFRYSFDDGGFMTVPYEPLGITAVSGSGGMSGFRLTSSDGAEYLFTEKEYCIQNNAPGPTAWHLTSIVTPARRDTIYFSYLRTSYSKPEFYEIQTSGYSCTPQSVIWGQPVNPVYDSQVLFTGYNYQVPLLQEIRWAGNKVTLSYMQDRPESGLQSRRLSSLTVTNCTGQTVRRVTFRKETGGTRLHLASLDISGNGSVASRYSFSYNPIPLPGYNTINSVPYCHEDFWGYYNGRSSRHFVHSEYSPDQTHFQGTDRSAVESYMKAEILTSIQYPAGGTSTFEYEANRSGGNMVGGLRVKTITTSDGDGHTRRDSYSYTDGRTWFPVQSYLYRSTQEHIFYTTSAQFGAASASFPETFTSSNSFWPVDGYGSMPVFYATVTRTVSDSRGSPKSKTIWGYMLDLDQTSDYGDDQPMLYSVYHNSDQGQIRPLLVTLDEYDCHGGSFRHVRSQRTEYNQHNRPAFGIGVSIARADRVTYFEGYRNLDYHPYDSWGLYYDSFHAYDMKAYPALRLPEYSVEHDMLSGMRDSVHYYYDSSLRTLRPVRTDRIDSRGNRLSETYVHAFSATAGSTHRRLYDMGYRDLATGRTVLRAGVPVQRISWTYDSPTGGCMLSSMSDAVGTGPYTEKLRVTARDERGNPAEILENGTVRTVLLWGYTDRQLPVAMVQGATYQEVSPRTSTLPYATSQNVSALVQNVKEYFPAPSYLTTAWEHQPLNGVSKVWGPDGVVTGYSYDLQGRLSSEYTRDSETICSNTYHEAAGGSYVKKYSMLNASGTEKMISVTHYDGLGRPVQSARTGFNTSGTSVVTAAGYDILGRAVREWLSVTGSATAERIADFAASAASFYAGEERPFIETEYEGTSNDITAVTNAGAAWAVHPRTVHRSANTAGEVRLYSASDLGNPGWYAAGTLLCERVTDEDERTVSVYRDREGRTVLERRGNDNDTYFIYNDIGQLRFVLSPEYQVTADTAMYAYSYQYDNRGRCTSKRLPGCGPVRYAYDNADRLIREQDAVMAASGIWRHYSYDRFGRPVSQWRDAATSAVPSATAVEEIHRYYDSYAFLDSIGLSASERTALAVTSQLASGMPTGICTKASDGTLLVRVMAYNGRRRLIAENSREPGGIISKRTYSPDFAGRVTSSGNVLYRNGTLLLSVSRTVDFASGTMLPVQETYSISVPGSPVQTNTRHFGYDDLGRLSWSRWGDSGESTSIGYDIHGWPESVSSSAGFTQRLIREEGGMYSGALAAMTWNVTQEGVARRYDYEYDSLGRLTASRYSDAVTGRYDETASYDNNGNITSMTRRGMLNDRSYGVIDNLTVTRTGNRLKKVTDSAPSLNYNGASDFMDGSSSATEYTYNQNGALMKDANRGISAITYDQAGHLLSVTFSGNKSISYVYSADGRKLSVTHTQPTGTTVTSYVGEAVFKGNNLSRYSIPGGYVSFSGNSASWHYYVQDYQGNNRMVVNGSGNVEQVTHYYPYGGVIGDISTNGDTQKYKFLGKELDRKFGLDWYDDEARMYDAIGVPRFTAIDPLAEKYYHLSPYSYCGGDPVNSIDPTGLAPSKKEGGRMINHIYDGNIGDIVEGWKCIEIQNNKKNGLKYGIYTKSLENGEFEYALVFAGTEGDDPKDIDTDMRQVFGKMEHYEISESGILVKSQYGEALDVSKKFLSDYGSAFDKTILGHSLGGALAAVGSMETGIQAITYNPAGLHKNTIRKLGLKNAPTKQITNYINVGDGVHLANCIMPQIVMPGQAEFSCSWRSFFFGYSILGLYENHRTINF